MPEYFSDAQRHLICKPYSVDNLHRMAEELKIHRCWFHRHPYPHYDIPKRRTQEIASLSQVVSSKEILRIIQMERSSSLV
jgi:hypothetical protein